MIPLDLEAQLLAEIEDNLEDLRGSLASVATDSLRVGGDQNMPLLQETGGEVIVRAA